MRRVRIACSYSKARPFPGLQSLIAVLACGVLLTGIRSSAQEATTGSEQVILRRVVLLRLPPPNTEDSRVRRLIATALAKRAEHRKRSRRASFSEPVSPTPRPGVRLSGHMTASDADNATPEQLRALADTLFAEALADRLQDRASVQVVPETDVNSALQTLDLTRPQAEQRAGAQRICEKLDCNALAVLRLIQVTVQEGATRDILVRATVGIPYFHTASTPVRKGRGKPILPFTLPARFEVAGLARCGRQFLRPNYSKTRASLVQEATQRAAAQAVHTLRTGEVSPFTQPGVRVALAPVHAPNVADKLAFTPQGRRLLHASMRDLPTDVSGRFLPDLAPLPAGQLLSPESTGKALRQSGLSPEMLWLAAGQPNIARVQALGRQIHVEYVLLAHVTELELDAGPPALPATLPPADPTEALHSPSVTSSTSQAPLASEHLERHTSRAAIAWEREGRAEATGALVRVSDGAVLWQDRASATLAISPAESGQGTEPVSDRRIVEDAIHFALVSLQRQLAGYQARFER